MFDLIYILIISSPKATVLAIEPVYKDEKTGQAVSHFRVTLCRGREAQGLVEVIEAT